MASCGVSLILLQLSLGSNPRLLPSHNGSSWVIRRVRLANYLVYLKAPPSVLPVWGWGIPNERKHLGCPYRRWVSRKSSQLLTQQFPPNTLRLLHRHDVKTWLCKPVASRAVSFSVGMMDRQEARW